MRANRERHRGQEAHGHVQGQRFKQDHELPPSRVFNRDHPASAQRRPQKDQQRGEAERRASRMQGAPFLKERADFGPSLGRVGSHQRAVGRRPSDEHDFWLAMKIPMLGRQSRSRKFQAVTAERNFRRGNHSNFYFRHQCLDQRHRGGEARKNFDEMFAWYAEGKLKPHISMRFPLEKGADAMNALLSRKATGKVVLTMA